MPAAVHALVARGRDVIYKVVHQLAAATIFLAGLACAQGSPDIHFSVTREGDFIEMEARVDLPVPPALAWSVLTDYEHYPDFISSMRESKVLSRGPDGIIVEQKGSFSILFFSQAIEVRLLVSEFPPNAIESRAIAGDFRVMRGHYGLKVVGDRVRLSYSGRLQSEFSLPPIFGSSIVRYLMLRNFREMVGEMLRRDAANHALPGRDLK